MILRDIDIIDSSLEFPNDITLRTIEQADVDEDVYGTFDSVSELMNELDD